ncbi:MAG: hypothetical protein L0228_19560 [Planctomycetes bacterium]|nr:hypothetical protein [Planctomycetota bacterium]
MLPDFRFNERVRGRLGRERRGLTVLEFAGCVLAVLGGMWIGAQYLGINVQHLAHAGLQKVQLLDNVPPAWRPEGPKLSVVTREQRDSALRQELDSLRNEITALQGGAKPASSSAPVSDATSIARNSTRAYWLRLNDIALHEVELQRDAETAIDDANAAKVFAIKGRVSRFAATSIEAVPSEGVEKAVLQFGRQLGSWYDRGGELHERAVRIWETSSGQQARSQLTEEWKQAELQHHNEARLLRDRAAALRASISRQFGEEFPEFAKPVTPAVPTPPADANATRG